jgi:hypothetical protein
LGAQELRDMATTHGTIELEDLTTMRDAMAALLTLTDRSVDILTRSLDQRLYDNELIIDQLKRVGMGSRRARIRILIHDATALSRGGHRLWALMRRLPSYFELRVPSRDYRNLPTAFLVADGIGSIYQPNSEIYAGIAEFYDPVRADALRRQFEQMWEPAQPSPELRTMTI